MEEAFFNQGFSFCIFSPSVGIYFDSKLKIGKF